MSDSLRTNVTFKSTAFNTSQVKDYFINDCCFGDDVARWLMRELRAGGIRTDEEPGQEDFGWYFTFYTDDASHDFVLAYRPGDIDEEGDWIGRLERRAGLFASLLGARNRGIQPAAAQAIHNVLLSSLDIKDVRWHFEHDFSTGREELGAQEP